MKIAFKMVRLLCSSVSLVVQLFCVTMVLDNVRCTSDSYLAFNIDKADEYRETVRGMFHRAYDAYMRYAYPKDELRPLTCSGMNTWGDFSLTLVDALDTLGIMGNWSEFRRAARLTLERVSNLDRDINISVFESNIRVVGGLLGAHMLARRAELHEKRKFLTARQWPCGGPLLELAERVAERLLPAFDTNTSMPYGTVNLMHGVPKGETTVTCTAAIGTFIVEFGTLSRLTGNPRYERAALRALQSLYSMRSHSKGLYGNHLDVQSGRWTMIESKIGSNIDSFFEYLVKGAVMLDHPHLMHIYRQARRAVDSNLLTPDDWYRTVHGGTGEPQSATFQSLESFWPGMLTLTGELEQAKRTMLNYASIARQFGVLPEMYNFQARAPIKDHEQYPMRPEYVESLYYLYRATKDPIYRHYAAAFVDALQHITATDCGYAVVRYVSDHTLEDRMESFFLAETLKYLYLIFDDDNFVHSLGKHSEQSVERLKVGKSNWCAYPRDGASGDLAFMFNTEAHLVDLDAIECCQNVWRERKGQNLFDYYDDLKQMGRWFRAQPPAPLQQHRVRHPQQGDESSTSGVHISTSHGTTRLHTAASGEQCRAPQQPDSQSAAVNGKQLTPPAEKADEETLKTRRSTRRARSKLRRETQRQKQPLRNTQRDVCTPKDLLVHYKFLRTDDTCDAVPPYRYAEYSVDDSQRSSSVRDADSYNEAKERIAEKKRRKDRRILPPEKAVEPLPIDAIVEHSSKSTAVVLDRKDTADVSKSGDGAVSFSIDEGTWKVLQEQFNNASTDQFDAGNFPSLEQMKHMSLESLSQVIAQAQRHVQQVQQVLNIPAAVRQHGGIQQQQLLQFLAQNNIPLTQERLKIIQTESMPSSASSSSSSSSDSPSSTEMELYIRMSMVAEIFVVFNDSRLLACDTSHIYSAARRFSVLNQVSVRGT